MEAAAEPHASDSSASPIGADAPASNPGAAAGARKRKAPAATARKPRKRQWALRRKEIMPMKTKERAGKNGWDNKQPSGQSLF
uniref:Uncharacterized protein n=1 Tax=Aegilops tauschii TaxID=37682 RepID=N1QSF4_AEGTA